MQRISDRIIDFTKELVSIKSQNGIDSERLVAQKVFEKLKKLVLARKSLAPENIRRLYVILRNKKVEKLYGWKVVWTRFPPVTH